MTDQSSPHPTEIRHHQKTRRLEVAFDDGVRFMLPAEYLRVYSPSAEVQGHGPGQEVLETGKEKVAIAQIVPVGNYAVSLHFDDDHDSGIYSFETLHDLGINQEIYWADYLRRLDEAGHKRKPADG